MTEESLFAAALEKSGAERRAILDAACAGDPRLRDRLERLIAADELPRGILELASDAAALLADPRQDTQSLSRPLHSTLFAEVLRNLQETDPPGYKLTEQIGEGGMGMVYRARDTRLDRDVAIKFLQVRFDADSPAARRFLSEARVTAQLQHPGVPPVHEVGALPDGRPYLVMKLIKGRTLADLLADEKVDRGRMLAAFEQVCNAVAYAHAHQVIHRDLKPSNVMVGTYGEVQVMDWGLAKVLDPAVGSGEGSDDEEFASTPSAIITNRSASDVTRTGSVLGTPTYMATEHTPWRRVSCGPSSLSPVAASVRPGTSQHA